MILLWRFLAVAALSILGSVAFLWWKAPPVLAAWCPGCFDFTQVAPDVWVDSAARAQRLNLERMTRFAMEDVDAVFGPGASRVTVLICTLPACATRMKAPMALGAAYGDVAILMTPFGLDPIVLRHELTHVARHRQVWPWERRVMWREEGLAEWIAKGPRAVWDCPAPRALPRRPATWRAQIGDTPSALYAEAHCAVSREIERFGLRAVALER